VAAGVARPQAATAQRSRQSTNPDLVSPTWPATIRHIANPFRDSTDGEEHLPKTGAGRRSVPPPAWLVALLREHVKTYPRGEAGLIFANRAGGAYLRTLFRSRV